MDRNKKICFVIMGFGKKQDPFSKRTIDLDENYNKIIFPAVDACDYQCIRADQIEDSGSIDRSMYALLKCADLVIADLTTLNPNAMYELGVRHTMRPSTTIIIGSGLDNIPFDINHIRIMRYDYKDDVCKAEEINLRVKKLIDLIKATEIDTEPDSPIYTLFRDFDPNIPYDEMENIIDKLQYEDKSRYALSEKAKELMKANSFTQAAMIWHELSERSNDVYFIQQEALCTYKSEQPSKVESLKKASAIMDKIKEQNDSETLGITGAINKRFWKETHESCYLEKGLISYQRGWILYRDSYTGENYAYCLDQKAMIEKDDSRKKSYSLQANDVRKEIITILNEKLKKGEQTENLKWIYATLANCSLAVGKIDDSREYEVKFYEEKPADWEKATYLSTKEYLITNNINKQ